MHIRIYMYVKTLLDTCIDIDVHNVNEQMCSIRANVY